MAKDSKNINDDWDEVLLFLKDVKMERYANKFEDEGYDRMAAIISLTLEDLLAIGVKRGHARIILDKKEQYKYNKLNYDNNINNNISNDVNNDSDNEMATIGNNDDDRDIIFSFNVRNIKRKQTNATIIINDDDDDSVHNEQNGVISRTSTGNDNIGKPYITSRPHSMKQLWSHNTDASMVSLPETVRIRGSVDEYDPHTNQYKYTPSGNAHSQRNLLVPLNNASNQSQTGTVVHKPFLDNVDSGNTDYESILDEEVNALSVIESMYKCDIKSKNYDNFHDNILTLTKNWNRNTIKHDLDVILNKYHKYDYIVFDLCGILYGQLNKINKSIKYFEKSLSLNNNYIECLHNYGYLLLLNQMDNIKCYNLFNKAISINPNFSYCYYHMGMLFDKQDKINDSIKCFKKAINIKSNYAPYHLDLANAYDESGNFSNAEKHYEICLQLSPNESVYYWNYAIALEGQKRYFKAENHYKRAIHIDKHCVDAYLNYALLLKNKPSPNIKKSFMLFEKAYDIDDSNEDLLIEYSKLCYNNLSVYKSNLIEYNKLTLKCELLYQKLIMINKYNPEYYLLYAQLLSDLNRIEDANTCYQRGMQTCNEQESKMIQKEYEKFLLNISNKYAPKSRKSKQTQKPRNNVVNTTKNTYAPLSPLPSASNSSIKTNTTNSSYQSYMNHFRMKSDNSNNSQYSNKSAKSNASNINTINKYNNNNTYYNNNNINTNTNAPADQNCIVM